MTAKSKRFVLMGARAFFEEPRSGSVTARAKPPSWKSEEPRHGGVEDEVQRPTCQPGRTPYNVSSPRPAPSVALPRRPLCTLRQGSFSAVGHAHPDRHCFCPDTDADTGDEELPAAHGQVAAPRRGPPNGLGLLLFVATPVTSVAQDLFVPKPVVPSVYLALAKAPPVTNSNAVVVILDDGVLVVDSHSKPCAARALVAQSRGLTDKPVRYVVNSHFHWDHAQGNRAYVGAWPADAEILSSEATRFNLEHIGIARIRADAALLPGTLNQLRERLAATTEQASHARLAEVEQSVGCGRDKGETVTEVAPVIRQRFRSRFPQGSLEDYLVPSIEKAWAIVAMPVK